MNDEIVIRAEAISKRYRISHQARQTTLCETLPHLARQAWQRLRGAASPTREDFWALKDINFDIKRGEVVGIIGRNGAGKSTLLKILSRITAPTTGRITLKGRVASLLEVGTGFHPELTGRDNIYLNGAILGMSRAEIRQKFDEIVAFAEVERFIDTPVKRYSSGMYVRLAFSVAAHLEPEILIVDEVLAVGDSTFQAKCLGKLRDVTLNHGRTVLLVSHNLAVVKSVCDSAIYLKSGGMVMKGDTTVTVDAYMSEATTGSVEFTPVVGDEVTLADLRLCNPGSSEAIQRATFDRPCELRVTLTGNDASLCVTPVIRLHDAYGTLVTSICGAEEGLDFKSVEPARTYICEISRLPLMPGRYFISVEAYSLASNAHLNAEQILSFEVEPSMLPGANRSYRQDHGLARVINRLRMEPGETERQR